MRRLLSLATLTLLATMLPMHGASAQPRVGPPLHTQLYIEIFDNGDGQQRSAYLDVSGTQCLPNDAPASVIVTVDRLADQVFTAKPDARGRWYVNIPIELPVDGVYVVNAECDNYFGTTVYPTARPNSDQVIIVSASSGGAGGGGSSSPPSPTVVTDPPCAFTAAGCVANTGNRTGSEVAVGFAALGLGLVLVWAGRPRRALEAVRSRNAVGRHRYRD